MIQVVDPAVVPEWKSKPKRALIAVLTTLAAAFALLLLENASLTGNTEICIVTP